MNIELRDGVYHLFGDIDEGSNFDPIDVSGEELHLNFAGLSHVNSIGIRTMLLFLTRWGNKPLHYHEIPAEMVTLLNTVPDMMGVPDRHALVHSVLAPLECDPCDHDEVRLLDEAAIEKIINENGVLKEKCPSCDDGSLEVWPNTFFDFLSAPK